MRMCPGCAGHRNTGVWVKLRSEAEVAAGSTPEGPHWSTDGDLTACAALFDSSLMVERVQSHQMGLKFASSLVTAVSLTLDSAHFQKPCSAVS